jgi:ribonuclease HI
MFSLLSNRSNKKNNSKVYPKCENVLYFNSSHPKSTNLEIKDHAGIGAVLINNNNELWGYCRYIGNDITPCEAEYYALIIGLEKALEDNIIMLSVCGDKLLIINQLNNISKIESKLLIPLYEKVNKIKSKFKYIDFNYIKPEDNIRARELSNIALNNMKTSIN